MRFHLLKRQNINKCLILAMLAAFVLYSIRVEKNLVEFWLHEDELDGLADVRQWEQGPVRPCSPLKYIPHKTDDRQQIGGRYMRNLRKKRKLMKFPIEPWAVKSTYFFNKCSISPDDTPSTMVFMVKSTCTNWERRNAIRDTWGGFKIYKGFKFDLVFILGYSANPRINANITHESDLFGDILMLQREDTASLVPDKVLAGMQWVVSKYSSHTVYASVDDDMLVHIPNLIQHIKSYVLWEPAWVGTPCYRDLPIICAYSYQPKDPPDRKTDSKWYMPLDVYPNDTWPCYCRGGMYLAPVKIVHELFKVSRTTERLYLDDVWITGFMRRKLGMGDTNIRPAPFSERSDVDLFKEVHKDHVIVSHSWGNTEYEPDDLAQKMKKRFWSWAHDLESEKSCWAGMPWRILEDG